MLCALYKAIDWIEAKGVPFIYSHALNRPLNPILHCHDFYEIIFLFTGDAIHLVNDVCYPMHEGDVVILRPMESHLFTKQSENLELFSISVTDREMVSFLNTYHLDKIIMSENAILFTLSHIARHTLLTMFYQLISQTNNQRENQIRVIIGSALHEFINAKNAGSEEWINSIVAHMSTQENLSKGVSALLEITNFSHAQLCRVVKKHTGKTPQQFVKDLRLNYAYNMIYSTNIPYEEIALQAGYSSFSHFLTIFKDRYGISPSALRKSSVHSLIL